MKQSVWLDLEDTVIDVWSSGRLLHDKVAKIKNFLNQVKPQQINIWSFAIWYEKQQVEFVQSGMKESLELELGSMIDQFPNMEQMRAYAYDFEHIRYDSTLEFMQLNGKAWSFIKFALQFNDTEFWLIDDAIPTMTIDNHQTNTIIHLLNIDRDLDNYELGERRNGT